MDQEGNPIPSPVYLANTTPQNHDIVYTGAITDYGTGDYHFYAQVSIDWYLYDRVYIRIFGADSIEQGEVTASYWDITGPIPLNPQYQFQSFETNGFKINQKDFFEVIPEPATLGLLGLGGCALAAWRRHRPRRQEEDNR